MSRRRIVLIGTPEFSCGIFEALRTSGDFEIGGLITQPDKPAGRGKEVSAPPAKVWAAQHSLPVLQPPSLKQLTLEPGGSLHGAAVHEPLISLLESFRPEVCVSIAYGKIIPNALIRFPRAGIVNVHPSLLPRWRGAAPIQWALMSGDSETGVCLMAVDAGLDTGGVYSVERVTIGADETCGELSARLATRSAEMLLRDLGKILDGTIPAIPQIETGATYAEKWEKEDAEIRWGEPAAVTTRRVRASSPDPGARTTFNGTLLKIFRVHTRPGGALKPRTDGSVPAPGEILEVNRAEVVVASGSPETHLVLDELQFPGKKRLPVAEILRGARFERGMRFGQSPSGG